MPGKHLISMELLKAGQNRSGEFLGAIPLTREDTIPYYNLEI
jgi:hypothetical protein